MVVLIVHVDRMDYILGGESSSLLWWMSGTERNGEKGPARDGWEVQDGRRRRSSMLDWNGTPNPMWGRRKEGGSDG